MTAAEQALWDKSVQNPASPNYQKYDKNGAPIAGASNYIPPGMSTSTSSARPPGMSSSVGWNPNSSYAVLGPGGGGGSGAATGGTGASGGALDTGGSLSTGGGDSLDSALAGLLDGNQQSGGSQMVYGMGALRQGIGQRNPPSMASALAGLKRAY
jgi:hypothetical protein